MSSLCRRYGSSTRRATATSDTGSSPGPAGGVLAGVPAAGGARGKITAIEVEALVFNILRTDRPREVETRSYTSTYDPLNWVIELP